MQRTQNRTDDDLLRAKPTGDDQSRSSQEVQLPNVIRIPETLTTVAFFKPENHSYFIQRYRPTKCRFLVKKAISQGRHAIPTFTALFSAFWLRSSVVSVLYALIGRNHRTAVSLIIQFLRQEMY